MKDFDIYLRKRLTECDIIVYSIPYRDGITVFDRLILECCLENYLLQKFIAGQTKSELVAHIDEMIKTTYERLNYGVEIGAEATFSTHYSIYSDTAKINIDAEDVKLLATTFEKAENVLQLIAQPVNILVGKSLGRGQSRIDIDMSLRNILKNSIEKFDNGVELTAEVEETHKTSYLDVKPSIDLMEELTNLCYRVYIDSSVALQIMAEVVETEIHYSLGSGESTIVFDSTVKDGDYAIKCETATNVLHILTTLVESIIQFMEPKDNAIYLTAEAGSIVRRYRLLEEMDDSSLSSFDDMTLEEVDYVILQD